jgi:N,N'-diacetyllegionaminate synthase
MTTLYDQAPFIIAEVGSNFRDLRDCLDSIAQAKKAGADAVKFQAYNSLAMFGQDLGRMKGELPLEWLPQLKEKADACGIEFMCTAFSPEILAEVDKYVEVHKIASSDLTHFDLLIAAKETGKPVLLSTGASSIGDISAAINVLGKENLIVLYCVSSYPTRMTDLRVMHMIGDEFDVITGFSDHSLDIVGYPVIAADNGAAVIEKHFTAIDADTPDRPHSLTVSEFKLMVDHIRGDKQPAIAPTVEERDMFLRHNRRLVATTTIHAGEHLIKGENFGAYRCLYDDSRGLHGFLGDAVTGKIAVKEIKIGQAIGSGDFA